MWHVTCKMWHNIILRNYKYSVLCRNMKTKVVQHVPRINISIWHMTCDSMTSRSIIIPWWCQIWILSFLLGANVLGHTLHVIFFIYLINPTKTGGWNIWHMKFFLLGWFSQISQWQTVKMKVFQNVIRM